MATVCEPQGLIRHDVRLVQEADAHTMLTGEMVQFQLLASHPDSIPIDQLQGFSPFVLCCAAINGYKDTNG
jgi:hypothetical protein